MNVQRSQGMDIDQYIKHIQSADGTANKSMPAEFTDNTGVVGDSDEEDKMNSTANMIN